jgi:hypothetical protein
MKIMKGSLLFVIFILSVFTFFSCGGSRENTADYPIQQVKLNKVTLTDNFWLPRIRIIHRAEQMFRLTGEAQYFDILERMLYNGVISGISLGGNRYLGMVYGATARHHYGNVDNAPLWKLWKEFGIEDAQMIGYWDAACPVKTNHPNVKATAYIRPGKILISIGNFDAKDQTVRLSFDWDKLDVKPSNAVLHAPAVENFQEERTFRPDENIHVKGKEGWLLILSQK